MERTADPSVESFWGGTRTFFKAHGHGNDYLVFARGTAWRARQAAVRKVCDRWRGPGGDGVVLVDLEQDPIALRMFNPDGGEFEKSGNGLRVTASWLFAEGHVGHDPFEVTVGGSRVRMRVHGRDEQGRLDVEAEMGEARFGAEAVALTGVGPLLGPEGSPIEGVAISMGNPHYVVFGSDLGEETLMRLGPWIAEHRRFSHGTNVQLARVVDGRLEIRIWERGVGRTTSSGTSACAAASAAVRTGRLSFGAHTVSMEGGTFDVTVREDWGVLLRGPVEDVMYGSLAEAMLLMLAG